jgi:hypothetical protein
MEWWQWLILCGGLALMVPICLIVSRLLDKLDIDPAPNTIETTNNISKKDMEE